MERMLRVTIDVPGLRRKLAAADLRELTEGEVREWLLDAAFAHDGDAWVVREKDLGQLEPDEVTSAVEYLAAPASASAGKP